MSAGVRGDLVGQRFGRLTVLSRAENSIGQKTQWLCRCDCGKEKIVRADHLTLGRVRSCRCLHSQVVIVMKTTHGHSPKGAWTPEYKAWCGMKERCSPNTNAKARKYHYDMGVRVCPEWSENFQAFLEYIGPKPTGRRYSIDRYPDPFGNYEPGNVRWANQRQQWENSRPEFLKRQQEASS